MDFIFFTLQLEMFWTTIDKTDHVEWKVSAARRSLILIAVLGVMALWYSEAFAFKLSPEGTEFEKSIAKTYPGFWQRALLWVADRGVLLFSEPVHEEVTNRIYDCQGDKDVCANPNIGFASSYVLAGVRWNDDPPFRLEEGEAENTPCKVTETIRFTTQPRCWAALFRDAHMKAVSGETLDANSRISLLARSHFGDLQFLHAMASVDGELASETKKRIMMWAEFTWRVAHRDYGLDTKLKEIGIQEMASVFGRSGWRVQDLFTLGNPALRPRLNEVAFGSLLHMMEDSFAKGHVDREEAASGEHCTGANSHPAPGRIREFHSYSNQDSKKHAEYDSREAFLRHWEAERPTVIEIGQVLLNYINRRAGWEEVKPFVDCIFELENSSAKASAGAGFKADD